MGGQRARSMRRRQPPRRRRWAIPPTCVAPCLALLVSVVPDNPSVNRATRNGHAASSWIDAQHAALADNLPRCVRFHHRCDGYAADVTDRRSMLTTFRERLDEIVRRSGLNRSQFAEQAEVDRSTLSQLLSSTNRRLPRVETLVSVAASQQVSLDWLLGLSNAGAMQAEMLQEQMALKRGVAGARRRAAARVAARGGRLQDPLRPVHVARSAEDRRRDPLRGRRPRRLPARAADRDRRRPIGVDPLAGDRSRVLQLGAGRARLRPRRGHLARPPTGRPRRPARPHGPPHRGALPDAALVPVRRPAALRRPDHDLRPAARSRSTSGRCTWCSRRPTTSTRSRSTSTTSSAAPWCTHTRSPPSCREQRGVASRSRH